MKIIQATDLRIRTREILEGVRWRDEACLVTTFGQPVAVLLSVAEYARLAGLPPEQCVSAQGASALASIDVSAAVKETNRCNTRKP